MASNNREIYGRSLSPRKTDCTIHSSYIIDAPQSNASDPALVLADSNADLFYTHHISENYKFSLMESITSPKYTRRNNIDYMVNVK